MSIDEILVGNPKILLVLVSQSESIKDCRSWQEHHRSDLIPAIAQLLYLHLSQSQLL